MWSLVWYWIPWDRVQTDFVDGFHQRFECGLCVTTEKVSMQSTNSGIQSETPKSKNTSETWSKKQLPWFTQRRHCFRTTDISPRSRFWKRVFNKRSALSYHKQTKPKFTGKRVRPFFTCVPAILCVYTHGVLSACAGLLLGDWCNNDSVAHFFGLNAMLAKMHHLSLSGPGNSAEKVLATVVSNRRTWTTALVPSDKTRVTQVDFVSGQLQELEVMFSIGKQAFNYYNMMLRLKWSWGVGKIEAFSIFACKILLAEAFCWSHIEKEFILCSPDTTPQNAETRKFENGKHGLRTPTTWIFMTGQTPALHISYVLLINVVKALASMVHGLGDHWTRASHTQAFAIYTQWPG